MKNKSMWEIICENYRKIVYFFFAVLIPTYCDYSDFHKAIARL